MSESNFASLGLNSGFTETLEAKGYETPSQIQAQSIPILLEGHDLLGVAQTGTGKTAAFTLPLLQRLDPEVRKPQILVLAPTRELGLQVAKAFESYAVHLPHFSVACLYGGQDIRIQLKALRSRPQVIVATPGRLIDHLNRGNVSFDSISAIVLDEADEMLKMGFQEDVENILGQAPDGAQMALFSATMPREIRRVADTFLTDPKEVHIDQTVKTVDNIEQRYLLVARRFKLAALERIAEVEDVDAGIIFVKTRQQTIEVAEHMEAAGFKIAPLNGDLQQNMREATVRQLTDGHLDWVVATDVAARGLDVRRITHVINYDIPFDSETYVHRIGRTGRAGRSGIAILMVSGSEMRQVYRIEEKNGASISAMEMPDGKQISDGRIATFTERLMKTIGQQDLKRVKKLVTRIEENHDIDPHLFAAGLLYLAQESRPLFPKLETIPEERARGGRGAGGQKGGRGERGGGKRERSFGPEPGFKTYRLAIGKEHKVRAGDIVGALANEGGINSSAIGNIKLFHNYSTVDLPEGIPNDVMQDLKNIRIRNVPSHLRPWSQEGPGGGGGNKGGFGGRKGGGFRKDRDGGDKGPRGRRQRGLPKKQQRGH
jgi:ATP-dependent RNA helicase DeaD